jgi:hypothetical protein
MKTYLLPRESVKVPLGRTPEFSKYVEEMVEYIPLMEIELLKIDFCHTG